MDKHVLHNILHRDSGNNSKDCPVCNGSINMDDKKALMSKANEVLDKRQQMGMAYNEDEQALVNFQFAELSSKARNDLEDSSFAYIDSKGGRHLPIPDSNHVRAALSRFDQTHFDSEEDKQKAKAKILAAAKKFGVDVSDEKKASEPSLVTTVDLLTFAEKNQLPKKIKILPYGTIKSPVYGNVVLNKQIMQEMIKHFEEDVRASSSKIGLPIDIEHGETDLKDAAAGWIKKLFAENDGGYAEVDWTPLGQRKLTDKEYKLLSPSFYLKGFKHPETGKEYENILTGAALVNKPGMPKSLPPLVYSEQEKNTPLTEESRSSTVFIELKNEISSKPKMNLSEIVAKEKTTRTSEEQEYLSNHKEELPYKDYIKEFGEVKASEDGKKTVKEGEVVMSEATLKDLQTKAEAGERAFSELQVLKQEKALIEMKEQVRAIAVEDGKGVRIPSDQIEKWATKLVSMSEADRNETFEMLKGLPVKEVLNEKGAENAMDMSREPGQRAEQMIEQKMKEMNITREKAQDLVFSENQDLYKQVFLGSN